MRAGRYDLVVESGARVVRVFQVWAPDPAGPIQARAVVAGDRIYYKGAPMIVFSTALMEHPTDAALSTMAFVLGSGAWWEPHFTIPADSLIHTATQATLLDAKAGFSVGADGGTIQLPVAVVDDVNVVLDIDAEMSQEMGVEAGSYSWDLYAEAASGWIRYVEGTLTVIRGDTFAPTVTPFDEGALSYG